MSLVGSSSGLGTSANGLALYISGSATPFSFYTNLPSYLTGLACTTSMYDGVFVSVSLHSAATCYLVRPVPVAGLYEEVDVTGYALNTTGMFLTGQSSLFNVYKRQLAAGECVRSQGFSCLPFVSVN